MLKAWHREDILSALECRGWSKPIQIEVLSDRYAVGEAWSTRRLEKTLKVFFVADYGSGYKDINSIESLIARVDGKTGEYLLWVATDP